MLAINERVINNEWVLQALKISVDLWAQASLAQPDPIETLLLRCAVYVQIGGTEEVDNETIRGAAEWNTSIAYASVLYTRSYYTLVVFHYPECTWCQKLF